MIAPMRATPGFLLNRSMYGAMYSWCSRFQRSERADCYRNFIIGYLSHLTTRLASVRIGTVHIRTILGRGDSINYIGGSLILFLCQTINSYGVVPMHQVAYYYEGPVELPTFREPLLPFF